MQSPRARAGWSSGSPDSSDGGGDGEEADGAHARGERVRVRSRRQLAEDEALLTRSLGSSERLRGEGRPERRRSVSLSRKGAGRARSSASAAQVRARAAAAHARLQGPALSVRAVRARCACGVRLTRARVRRAPQEPSARKEQRRKSKTEASKRREVRCRATVLLARPLQGSLPWHRAPCRAPRAAPGGQHTRARAVWLAARAAALCAAPRLCADCLRARVATLGRRAFPANPADARARCCSPAAPPSTCLSRAAGAVARAHPQARL
jgi:hypothetical protein